MQNSKMVVILREVVRVHIFVDAATEPALHAVAGCSMTLLAFGFPLSFGMTADSVSSSATPSWREIGQTEFSDSLTKYTNSLPSLRLTRYLLIESEDSCSKIWGSYLTCLASIA